MKLASGIFIIRKDGKFLVGHPTGHPPNFFSIPKGMIEDGENSIDAAIRETFEETNINLSGWKTIVTLTPKKYKKTEKILYPFVIFETQNDFDFDSFNPKCNSIVPNRGFPEMDEFKWLSIEEGKDLVHETQKRCLEEIEEIIKSKGINS